MWSVLSLSLFGLSACLLVDFCFLSCGKNREKETKGIAGTT